MSGPGFLFFKELKYTLLLGLIGLIFFHPDQGQSVEGMTVDASEKSSYIEELKSHNSKLSEPLEQQNSYSEQLRSKLRSVPQGEYIEEVKRARPENFSPAESQEAMGNTYLESEKIKLESVPKGGAIDAVNQGNSVIKLTKRGTPHFGAGIRVGVSATRHITATSEYGLATFNSIYKETFSPDIELYGEWQPLNNDYVGSLGVEVAGGFTYNSGFGAFESLIGKPTVGGVASTDATTFSGTSRTKFQFVTIPVSALAIYRFNLPYYVRPFIAGGPSMIGYYEGRGDGKKGNRGYSFGLDTKFGVAFLLDFLSKRSSFDLYDNDGIHHSFLTVEYNRQIPFSSEVEFASGVVVAGLAFEF